ncbi:MAG TPA: hypothetical protein VF389_11770 [Woeseiaceae bacterium]
MSGNHSRNKGYRFEAEMRSHFQGYGLNCIRVPLSGQAEGDKCDLVIRAGFDNDTKYQGECKRRKIIPKWIPEALNGVDFLVMRGDRGEALVVIRPDLFAELLQ